MNNQIAATGMKQSTMKHSDMTNQDRKTLSNPVLKVQFKTKEPIVLQSMQIQIGKATLKHANMKKARIKIQY